MAVWGSRALPETHDTNSLPEGENPIWSHYHLSSKGKTMVFSEDVLDKPVSLGWTGDSESVRKWPKPLSRNLSGCPSSALRRTS